MTISENSSIKDALQRLMTVMTNLGLEPPSHLRPGLTRQKIIAVFAELGLVPSEGMIGFYEFSDGVLRDEMHDHQIALFSGYHILPLEEAAYEYEEILGSIRGIEGVNEPTKAQFPFLAWDNWYYLIDFAAEQAGQPCILSFDPHARPEIEHDNLRTMFNALADAYEQGKSIFDNGVLNVGPEDDGNAKSDEVTPKYGGLVSPRFSRNTTGPQGAVYLVSYVNPRTEKTLYEVDFTLPTTDRVPPIGYVTMRSEGIDITDAQIIANGLRDIQNHYGVILDISIEESLAWRKKMSEYTRTLAKASK